MWVTCFLGSGYPIQIRNIVFLANKIFSVADPGCLSQIPDPDFYPSRIPDLGSRIPDPKTAMIDIGEKNLLSYLFFGSQKYGFGIRDPGSGKNLFRIPDPGDKKAPDPGSGSATLKIFLLKVTVYRVFFINSAVAPYYFPAFLIRKFVFPNSLRLR